MLPPSCGFSAAKGQATFPLHLQDVHGGAVTVVLRPHPLVHRLGAVRGLRVARKAHRSDRYCCVACPAYVSALQDQQ